MGHRKGTVFRAVYLGSGFQSEHTERGYCKILFFVLKSLLRKCLKESIIRVDAKKNCKIKKKGVKKHYEVF